MRSTTRSEQHGGVGGKNKRAFWPWKSLSLQIPCAGATAAVAAADATSLLAPVARTVRERPEPKRVVSLGWMTLERRWNRVDSGHWIMNIMYTADLFFWSCMLTTPHHFLNPERIWLFAWLTAQRGLKKFKAMPCKFFEAPVFCMFNYRSGTLKSCSDLLGTFSLHWKLTFICFQLQLFSPSIVFKNWSWKETNVSFEAFLEGNQGWYIKGQVLK